MKAQDLLSELKSQITMKPDKGQAKVFEEKYTNTKAEIFEKASALLEDYGELLASPVIQVMTACERDRLGNTIVATIPLSSINARTYKADNNDIDLTVSSTGDMLVFTLHDIDQNILEKSIRPSELSKYIVGINIINSVGAGRKKEHRKCSSCKHFTPNQTNAKGYC